MDTTEPQNPGQDVQVENTAHDPLEHALILAEGGSSIDVEELGVDNSTAKAAIQALNESVGNKRNVAELSDEERRNRRLSRIAYGRKLVTYTYPGRVTLTREIVLNHRRISRLYDLYLPFANIAFISLERDGNLLPAGNASDRKQELVARIRELHGRVSTQLSLAQTIILDAKAHNTNEGTPFYEPKVVVPASTQTINIHDKHANQFLEILIMFDKMETCFQVMEWNEIRTKAEIKEFRSDLTDAWLRIASLAVKTFGDLYSASRKERKRRQEQEAALTAANDGHDTDSVAQVDNVAQHIPADQSDLNLKSA